MQHFNEEAWSDFVRGAATEELRGQIERHLAQPCGECRTQLTTWQNVAAFAEKEKIYTPPADVVRMVEMEFQQRQPEQQPMLALLRFDSFAQPLMAGVRSGNTVTARQVLYEAGGIAVDLRLESQPGCDQVCAVGQVQDRSARGNVRPSVPVTLLNPEGNSLKQVFTNEFGEFQFEFRRDKVARIAIEIGGNRMIHIPLADLEGYLHSS